MTEHDGAQSDAAGTRLVEAAMAGDAEAIRAVWNTHRRWVAALLLAYKPREASLEDLLQEVAVTLVRRIDELREPEAFRPWIRSVAINAARLAGRKQTLARKHGRKIRLLVEHETLAPQTPDVAVAQRDDARRLLDLAMELPETYREPLLLRCMQGMSYREIGQATGLPETTIETRIARGRRMLREKAAAQESVARQPRPTLPGVQDGVREESEEGTDRGSLP